MSVSIQNFPSPEATTTLTRLSRRFASLFRRAKRKEIIRAQISKEGLGIEIGPCHNPVTPKRDGYKVHIIDHLDREGLVNKYKDHGIKTGNIEEVDFIWRGESYASLTGKRRHYDWIIASHVIEHTPDLVGFLNSCDEVLKEDGLLALVIPDKRYCFDRFRPITGLAKIIDSHLATRSTHTPGTIAEHILNVVSRSGAISWNKRSRGEFTFIHTNEEALQNFQKARDNNEYIDAHAWCFVPSSFRLLIHDLHQLNLIPFQEVFFHPTKGCEFYVTLSRSGAGPKTPRLELLKAIEKELFQIA